MTANRVGRTAKLLYGVALLLLCSAYLEGGAAKLLDTNAASAEMTRFGVPLPNYAAMLAIATELGGSCLILSGILRWAGALLLAGFTDAGQDDR
jgi:uncharacterized membrane protein YphA (DoxX/SURF4 family)